MYIWNKCMILLKFTFMNDFFQLCTYGWLNMSILLEKLNQLLLKNDIPSFERQLKRTLKKKLGLSEKISVKLLEVKFLQRLGKYREALHVIQDLLSENLPENNLEYLDILLRKVDILLYLKKENDIVEAINLLQIIQEKLELHKKTYSQDISDLGKRKLFKREMYFFYLQGRYFEVIGESDKAVVSLKESLSLSRKLGDKEFMANILNLLGILEWKKGNLKSALDYFSESHSVAKFIGDVLTVANVLNNTGVIYWQSGYLDDALQYFAQAVEIWKQIKNYNQLAAGLNNIGLVYRYKGELATALDYFYQSLSLWEDMGVKSQIGLSKYNIGVVFRQQADFDQALNYLNQAFHLFTALRDNYNLSLVLDEFGVIQCNFRNLEKARQFFLESLNIKNTFKNDVEKARTLLNLIILEVDDHNMTRASEYFRQLQEIGKLNPTIQIVQYQVKVAQGILFAVSSRLLERMRALDIFSSIVASPIIDHELTTYSLIRKAELLAYEISIVPDEKALADLKTCILMLQDFSKKEYLYSLFIFSTLLKAKLAQIEFNWEKASKYYLNAQLLAEEKGLLNLAVLISKEYSNMLQLMKNIKEKNFHALPLSKRLELGKVASTFLNPYHYYTYNASIPKRTLKKEQFEVCVAYGSFTDRGMAARGSSDNCFFSLEEIDVILNFIAVILQQGSNRKIYGPLPPATFGKEELKKYSMLVYGFRTIDATVKDQRVKQDNYRVQGILLIFYPEEFDVEIVSHKKQLEKYLSDTIKDNQNVEELCSWLNTIATHIKESILNSEVDIETKKEN